MITLSKQPPAGHNKYYFLKANLKANMKDYYQAKFQVYIIFSFQKSREMCKFLPPPPPPPPALGRMTPRRKPG